MMSSIQAKGSSGGVGCAVIVAGSSLLWISTILLAQLQEEKETERSPNAACGSRSSQLACKPVISITMRCFLLVLVLSAAALASSYDAAAESPEFEAGGPPASEYTGKHPWRRMRWNSRDHASAADLASPSSPLAEAADATSAAAVVPTQSATTAAEEGMPVLEAASDVAVATASVPAGCTTQYTETDIRPIRVMWNSSYGYCAEASLQMILMARGVWIGQAQARSLAKCGNSDLILNSRAVTSCSVLPLLTNSLAFDTPSSHYWDDSNQALSYATATSSRSWPYSSNKVGYTNPPATSFLQWAKRHIVAGRPVILAVRLAKSVLNDPIYDHIVPAWGVCSTDISTNAAFDSNDAFSLSTDFADEVFRSTSTPGFYSRWQECPNGLSWGKVGCIPTDIWNYGIAVGHLKDSGGILVKTAKLVITGWSDKSAANYEPGEGYNTPAGNSVTARYTLTVSNLVPGSNYTTYRLPGRLPPVNPRASASKQYTPSNPAVLPSTAASLRETCAARSGCTSTRYTAPASGQVTLTEATLGTFVGNSLQYFFTVAT